MFERVWGSTGSVVEPDVGKAEEGWNTTEFPRHDWQNWFMNLVSIALQQIETTGRLEWDADASYQAGVIVNFSGTYYYSLTATQGDQPNTSPTEWTAVGGPNYIHALSDVNGLVNALSLKANLASPAFSGLPSAPTAAPASNTTQIANTQYVAGELSLKANVASPAFTGNPTAPTQSPGTNNTRLANTAFVANGLSSKSDTSHNHSGVYSPVGHGHSTSDISDLLTGFSASGGNSVSSTGTTSRITLPDFLAGFTIQSGVVTDVADESTEFFTFPAAFTTVWGGLAIVYEGGPGAQFARGNVLGTSAMSATQYHSGGGSSANLFFVAWGVI